MSARKESFYVLVGPTGSVFVKEAELFRDQGGLREEWGRYWHGPVDAKSIEDARDWGEKHLTRFADRTVRVSL